MTLEDAVFKPYCLFFPEDVMKYENLYRQSAALRMVPNCACQGIILKAPSSKSLLFPQIFQCNSVGWKSISEQYMPYL